MTGQAFQVEETNTYVRLFDYDKQTEQLLRRFCIRSLARWGKVPGETYGSYKFEISHVFATFSPDKSELRLIKGFYKELVDFMKLLGSNVEGIAPLALPVIEPKEAEFKWKSFEVKPRNQEQQDYLDFTLDEKNNLVVINGTTGFGKTVVAIMAFVKLGYRVVITVLPRYVPIWFKAFGEFLDLKPEDVLNVSDHDINKIYEALKNGTINPKVVFFQLTRIDTYIKRMREAPDTIPHLDDFFKAISPGVRLIDEAHESIYSVYTSMLYGNIFKNIGLSATLRGDDEFINKIYKGAFPDSAYLKAPIYEKYINVVSYYHRMNMDKYRINTKGFGGYSHVLYEKGILRKASIFENYYQMCKEAFVQFYIEGKREGQKAMWFFATVAMCNRFCERLKRDYPDLDIFVFTGEISKKKGMEQEYNNHEVVITTPGSCATGKDVERLYVVFAGISVSSMQRVDQMSGRTRPITKWWPDLDPIFLTFVCRDVRKQVEYDGKKKQIISKKAKKFTTIDSGRWV